MRDSQRRALPAMLVGMSLLAGSPATADIRDYGFQLLEPELKTGDGSVVAVRLIDKRSGAAVPDALIFARRIDMAPDNMAAMTATLEPLPSSEAGVYRFKTNLTMEGRWRLSLAAKIQGEVGSLEARLILKAVP